MHNEKLPVLQMYRLPHWEMRDLNKKNPLKMHRNEDKHIETEKQHWLRNIIEFTKRRDNLIALFSKIILICKRP